MKVTLSPSLSAVLKDSVGVLSVTYEPSTYAVGPREDGVSGAALKFQLVLPPESVMLRPEVWIAVAFVLFESLTSRYASVRVP